MKITIKQLRKIIKEELERFMPTSLYKDPAGKGIYKDPAYYKPDYNPSVKRYEPGIEEKEKENLITKEKSYIGGYVYEPEKMHAAIQAAFAQPMRK